MFYNIDGTLKSDAEIVRIFENTFVGYPEPVPPEFLYGDLLRPGFNQDASDTLAFAATVRSEVGSYITIQRFLNRDPNTLIVLVRDGFEEEDSEIELIKFTPENNAAKFQYLRLLAGDMEFYPEYRLQSLTTAPESLQTLLPSLYGAEFADLATVEDFTVTNADVLNTFAGAPYLAVKHLTSQPVPVVHYLVISLKEEDGAPSLTMYVLTEENQIKARASATTESSLLYALKFIASI